MAKIKGWNPEIKRQKILNAAMQILNRKEYHKCPIDEIAKSAGVAKGTIYLYFKSKEELYFSIFFMLIDKVKELAKDVQKKDLSASKQLYLLLKQMSDFIEQYKQIFSTIRHVENLHKEKFHFGLHRKIGEMIITISEIIERGIKSGEFRKYNAISLSVIFLSLTSIIAHQKVEVKPEVIDMSITPQFLWNVFSKGISK